MKRPSSINQAVIKTKRPVKVMPGSDGCNQTRRTTSTGRVVMADGDMSIQILRESP